MDPMGYDLFFFSRTKSWVDMQMLWIGNVIFQEKEHAGNERNDKI
jgi:hypothetical protein